MSKTPNTIPPRALEIPEHLKRAASKKIEETTIVHPQTQCWEWTRQLVNGYGRMRVDGKSQLVHRIMYAIVKGPIPEGVTVQHECKNKKCCNPQHLSLMSWEDNYNDRGQPPPF